MVKIIIITEYSKQKNFKNRPNDKFWEIHYMTSENPSKTYISEEPLKDTSSTKAI